MQEQVVTAISFADARGGQAREDACLPARPFDGFTRSLRLPVQVNSVMPCASRS